MALYTGSGLSADSAWRRFRDGFPPAIVCAMVLAIGLMVPLLLLRLPMTLVVGAGMGIIGLGLIVACPYLGLLVFLGLLYLRPEEIWPALAGARLTLMVSLVAMFAWLINGLMVRERFRLNLPAVQCFLLFVVVAVGSTLISGSGTLGEEALELLKLLVLFVLIAHLLNSERRIQGAMVALVLFSAVMGARTILRFYQGEALVQSDGAVRAIGTGIFSDPNDLSLAMAMAIPLALGIGLGLGRSVTHQSWWGRILCLGSVPIFLWTVFVTDSRGGMLALGAAIFLYFRRRLGRVGLVLGGLAVLVLFAAGPARMSKMDAEEKSAAGRIHAWQQGIEMLTGSPIWGVGKGQFVERHNLTAHNSFVLCFSELGIVGTVAWLGLFYFVFRDARVLAGRDSGSAAESPGAGRAPPVAWSRFALVQISLMTFGVGGFFLSRTYSPPLYVYLALGLAAAQVEAETRGVLLPPASARDWGRLTALALGGIVLIWLMVRFLG